MKAKKAMLQLIGFLNQEVARLNNELKRSQIDKHSMLDLYNLTKKERDESVEDAILKEVTRPRTYFEIASSDPIKPFEAGEVAHIIHTELGVVYDCDVTIISTNGYPIKVHGESFQPNGKHYVENSFRSLFTTAEMVEMGYEIPDLE